MVKENLLGAPAEQLGPVLRSRRVALLAQSISPPSGSKSRGHIRETFRTARRKIDGALRIAKAGPSCSASALKKCPNPTKKEPRIPCQTLFPPEKMEKLEKSLKIRLAK